MKPSIKYILCLCVFYTLTALYAQQVYDPVKENAIDRLIETIAENTDEEIDYTALVEGLNDAYDNPVNLNTASRGQLERLILLSDYQIDQLYVYIERHGPLLTIYELQVVPGWDEETIYLMLPFIK